MTREEEILIEKVIWLIEDSYPDTDEWSHDRLVTNIKEDLKRRENELDRMFFTHLKNPWHKAWEELPQESKYIENTMQGRREWTESEQVLVINNHYQKSVDSIRNGEWVRLRNLPADCDGFKTSYLYWMEIPELPKEEEI